MAELWCHKVEREAVERLQEILARPLADDPQCQSCEDFDPWDLFPTLYGSYSSDFDDLAIEVLETVQLAALDDWDAVRERQKNETLAHEMFREILCTSNLCSYGTSPRVCFATIGFKGHLPQLIERWKGYYELQWGAPYSAA